MSTEYCFQGSNTCNFNLPPWPAGLIKSDKLDHQMTTDEFMASNHTPVVFFYYKTQLPSMHKKALVSMHVHLETLRFPSSYSKPLVLAPSSQLHARQPGNVNNHWVRAQCQPHSQASHVPVGNIKSLLKAAILWVHPVCFGINKVPVTGIASMWFQKKKRKEKKK